MNKKYIYLIIVIILAGLLITCGSNTSDQKAKNKTQQVKTNPNCTPVPYFALNTLSGDTFNIDDHLGNVILIDFWATWCRPCLLAIPHLNDLYNEHKNNGLSVVGLSLDQDRGNEFVNNVATQLGVNYPIVMVSKSLADRFGEIRGIPTVFIIDREGCIRDKIVGYKPKEELEQKILPLLDEPPPA